VRLQGAALDVAWYAGLQARFHLNSFRVDTVVLPTYGGASGVPLVQAHFF
jgi:hypothetical protein